MKKLISISILFAVSSYAQANCDDVTQSLIKAMNEHSPEKIVEIIRTDSNTDVCINEQNPGANKEPLEYLKLALSYVSISAEQARSRSNLAKMCRNAAWQTRNVFIPYPLWVRDGGHFRYTAKDGSYLDCGIYLQGDRYVGIIHI